MRPAVACWALVGCAQIVGIHDYQGDAPTDAAMVGSDASNGGCAAGLSEDGICPHDLSAGVDSTCVLSNGLWCWGQLIPTSVGEPRPTQEGSAGVSLVVLAGSPDPTPGTTEGVGCYLENGSAMCWGPNSVGQLGYPESTVILTPVAENPAGDLVSLAVGGDHVCAAAGGRGNIACTGETDKDEIDGGMAGSSCGMTAIPCDTTATTIPIMVGDRIAAGGAHTCTSPANNYGIGCWGDNSSGQLGNSSAGLMSPLMPVLDDDGNPLGSASALALGTNHSCAIVGMTTYCWGDNLSGELGEGADAPAEQQGATPVELPPDTPFVTIAAGGETTCAIDTNGGVWCWGSDRRGAAGQPPIGSGAGIFPQSVTAPAAVPLGSGVVATAIAVGFEHACALASTGDIYCWGDNTSGELGDGLTMHGEPACGAQDCSYVAVKVKP